MTQTEIDNLLKRKEELNHEYDELCNRRDELSAIEQAIKLAMNSTYGAYINNGFAMSCSAVGKSVTGMGRTVINYMEKKHVDYWLNKWHLDKELHEKLGIKNEVKPISPDETITIYGDTDSIIGNTWIWINKEKIKIEDFYNSIDKKNSLKLDNGKEIIPLIDKKTYSYSDNQIKEIPVKNLIRHKNEKKLYKIKLKSGKEVICTEDHNIVVMRNGEWLNIKPNEILNTDQFLVCENPL